MEASPEGPEGEASARFADGETGLRAPPTLQSPSTGPEARIVTSFY